MTKACGKPSKRERTRAHLINAALDVLAERGLEATSIDDFMEVAGMARGTFYNYFQSRDEVLVAVGRYVQDQVLEHVIASVSATWDDETTVAAVTFGLLRFFVDNPRLGWVQIRLGGGMRWLEERCAQHPVAAGTDRDAEHAKRERALEDIDRSLAAVMGDSAPLLAGIVYLEGSILMVLRRLLEERVTVPEAECVLRMTLRGLGIPERRLDPVMDRAREFACELKESE